MDNYAYPILLQFKSHHHSNHPSFLPQETQMMARVRQQRFTQDELDILVREIQARYHRLYTKGLPFAVIRRAWEEVAAAVTAAGVGPVRTASACQTRFRDLKRRSRIKLTSGVGTRPLQRSEKGSAGEDAQSASKSGICSIWL